MSQLETSKEELIEFVSLLRQKGFGVSPEQYISAHRLLCVFTAQPSWPDPSRLGWMLAPLLCSSREEQESFPRLYEHWLGTRPTIFRRDEKAKTLKPPAPPHVAGPEPWRPRLKWWGWATVLGVATLIGFIIYKSRNALTGGAGGATATPTGVGNAGAIDWALVALIVGRAGLVLGGLVILYFVVTRLLRYTSRLGLKKWRARGDQRVDKLKVRGASEQLLRTLPLRRIAQEMRRYRPFDETDLDVPRTVEETIRAGVFTPAFTSRKARPEYLVLIDRANPADQQARLADDIISHLIRNDVSVERYFFQEDPRICRKEDARAPFQPLQELALQHPRHYLLIFSDGAGFFNPLTGQPHRWLEMFASWPTRLLLTSEAQAGDYRDWVLSELGFRVLPAGRAGLMEISESLDGGLPRRRAGAPRGAALPPLLRERPGHWLKSHPPQPETIGELCRQLKGFLGDAGYYWLSACAVYPLLYLDLTFYLGEKLVIPGDLFETYSKLVRLPWFRIGSMPDWLRARLIVDLDAKKEQAVRAALEDLLIDSLKQPDGSVLPIVTAPKPDAQDRAGLFRTRWGRLKEKVRARIKRQLAEDILRAQQEDGRLRDYVAVTFMSGRKPNKLVVKLPRELYPTLYPASPPVIDRFTKWMIIVVNLLVSSILLLPALAGTLPAIVGSVVVWAFFMGLNVWAVRELARDNSIAAKLRALGEAKGPSALDAAGRAATKVEETVIAQPVQETASVEVLEPEGRVGKTTIQPASTSVDILPIFVSSTWLDLEPERKAVEQAIRGLRETQYVGIEYFGSRSYETSAASLDEVDRSSVYVGIVGGRYGSGITEVEYDRARRNGQPCFIYFKDESAIPGKWFDTEPAQLAKLDDFKRKLRANHLIGFDFKSPDELAAKVTADLHRWLFEEYLTPALRDALRGAIPRSRAQSLLDAIKDLIELNRDLLTQLRDAGFNVALGARGVAIGGDIRSSDIFISGASPPAVPTLHQLRAPVSDFVGREKAVDELLSALRRGSNASIVGISGMGGIGKTELAFYVAERLRDTYPDAQLVLDMRGTDDPPRDPSDALASCIRAFLGLEQRLPDTVQELTQIYRSILEGKRALILLDNAADSAQVRPLLPPAGSALLVTSRGTIALPGMKRVTLEQLDPTAARELLIAIAPRVTPDVADEICYLCGYLPLAIRAAGSLLDVTVDLDPANYAAQLRDERTRHQLIIGNEGVDIGVEASFNLSYSRLSPEVARVFRELSVFLDSFDAHAEEVVCEDRGHRHLSELLRHNLVRYNEDTRRYSLHNLARLFADSRLSKEERRSAQVRHAAHYLKVLHGCSELYLKGSDAVRSGLALFDSERQNIEAGQEWTRQYAGADETAARLCSQYPISGAYVLYLRLHPREFISWHEAALAAARQFKNRASEGRLIGNLGIAYADLGETRRAVEFYEQALAINREMGDRRTEGITLGSLGVAYTELGEMRRAIEFHEESLAIASEIGDRMSEAAALADLGLGYAALGEYRRAIEFHKESLALAYKIGDRRNVGRTLGNLGMAYAALGETRQAMEFYEQCLLVAREIGDSRVEGNILFNLGLAFDKLGERIQAVTYAEAALEILEQIESPQAAGVREQLLQWRGSTG